MLNGWYKEDDLTVYLQGYDMTDNFLFYLSCSNQKDVLKVDKGITVDNENGTEYYAPSWENLYLSIGPSYVSVSMYTQQDGKFVYKNDINAPLLQRLSSLIRGLKMSCYTSNRTDAIDLIEGEFIPKKVVDYEIGTEGRVTLDMGTVLNMSYKSSTGRGRELSLIEDGTYDLKVNRITPRQHKIRLDLSDYEPQRDDLDWDFGEDEVFSLSDIIERNPEKSYLWLKSRKYEVIKGKERMEEVCKEIANHKGIVSFDTETTGLNITFKSRVGQGDRLVGMVFSIREGEAWYFPVAHKKVENICTPEDENYVIEKYFKYLLEHKELVCHNGSFDWKVMHIYDICLNLVHDTMILFKLSEWNLNHGLGIGLKNLAKLYLNRDSFELSDFVSGKWGEGEITFSDLPEESVKYYACPDTDSTLALLNYSIKNNLFDKFGMRKTYDTEVAFSIVIAYQEFYGHCADVDRTEELSRILEEGQKREYAEMVKIVGHDFNPSSTKELPKVLFEELGYPSIFKTDTGRPSTGKKTLKWLLDKTDENGDPIYPFAHHLKKWKDYSQLKSNFIDVLGKWATEDGFMFSEVKQFLETGRVSVKNPNYQSYNDEVKKYIVPRKGFYMMDSDYSSIEYRILSCMAEQKNLIERFADPDMDYHTYQASRMFSVPYELVDKKLRSQAKGINFGLPYGMGDKKLGESIFGTRTPENTLKAARMRRLYFEGQENIEKFFVTARKNGVDNGFSETHFGRRRYFDRRSTDVNSIEREAGNNRIQGTAADIYKMAMVRLFTRIRKNGWMGKVLISAFVHDECVLEVHKSIDPCVMLSNLRDCLMLDIEGWCPLYIGAGFGTNWYDAKKTEIPVQVQQQMVDTWGEQGIDWWNGDTEKLFYWEVGLINDYKRDRVINYLKDEENWHKVLQPVENGFAHEVLEEVLSGRHVGGVVDKDIHTDKDVVNNLGQFCKCFGLEDLFEKADIQRPVYKAVQEDNVATEIDDWEEESEEDKMRLLLARIKTMGVCYDGDNLYIKLTSNQRFMDIVIGKLQEYEGTKKVVALKGDKLVPTNLSTSIKVYSKLIDIYRVGG